MSMEQPIIFSVENVSNDEVLLCGGICRAATRYEPEEYEEISKSAAEALDSSEVFIVGYRKDWAYITDAGDEDAEMDVFSIARRLSLGSYVSEAEMVAMQEWLVHSAGKPADKIWDMLTESAQERYNDDDHGDYPEPDDYM